jgi:hypothetical protein
LPYRQKSRNRSASLKPKAAHSCKGFPGEYSNCSTIQKPLFMQSKTYNALLARLRQIEAQASNRDYNSKSINQWSLKPNNMYRVQLAAVANA